MKESLDKFYTDLKLARVKCPWANKQTLLLHIKELEDEIEELKIGINNNDKENIKEELGDVFMDAYFLLVIAEEMGINPKEVVEHVNEKIVRRKPWVYGDMKINTPEEAKRVWKEIKQKEKKQLKQTEEIVDIVDENDKVLGQIKRKDSDKQKLRQRISRILIFDSKNRILIQKRTPTKSTYPNHWDFGVAETVQAGEDYDSTAIRGLKEELDINVKNVPKFLFKMNFDNDLIKRNYQLYQLIYDGKMKFQEKEISEIKFVTKEELKDMRKENEKFSPGGLAGYNKYLEEYNGKKN